ncbi:MAG: ATPase, partial [Clostridia bacterium]|nr:ATPase [Clostridia bacterium]
MLSHSQSKEEILSAYSTDVQQGLSTAKVDELKQKYGQNRLREGKKKTNLQRFLDQFKDVMIIILILAAIVSFTIACIEGEPKEFFEPALILLIIII